MKVELVITDDNDTVESVTLFPEERAHVSELVDMLIFHCEKCKKDLLLLYMSSEPTMCNNCFVDHLTNTPDPTER